MSTPLADDPFERLRRANPVSTSEVRSSLSDDDLSRARMHAKSSPADAGSATDSRRPWRVRSIAPRLGVAAILVIGVAILVLALLGDGAGKPEEESAYALSAVRAAESA